MPSDVRILINITSMTPVGLQWAAFPGCFLRSPRRSIKVAQEIGYDGCAGTSQRGSRGDEDLEACEKEWNAVPGLLHALRHREGAGGMPSCLNDWVVFPSPWPCIRVENCYAKRDIVRVVHRVDELTDRSLLEINPEMGVGVRDLVGHIEHLRRHLGWQCGLCLDTEHGVRPCHNGQVSPIAREYRDQVRPGVTKVTPMEVWEWLVDVTAQYTAMLHAKDCEGAHADRARYAVAHLPYLEDIVAERRPSIKRGDLLPRQNRQQAAKMLEFLRELKELSAVT
jgi:hypothetical protein